MSYTSLFFGLTSLRIDMRLIFLSLFSLALSFVACTPQPCEQDGETAQHGHSFVAEDGCNVCYCDNGQIRCTQTPCPKAYCDVDGNIYKEGETFLASNGCSRCTCLATGQIECDEKKCKPCKEEDGTIRQHDESFEKLRGCIGCRCSNGTMTCERKPCKDGCTIETSCPSGTFCKYPGGLCPNKENLGLCFPIPKTCSDVEDPVCGCDKKTYSSDCQAHINGISVTAKGPCP